MSELSSETLAEQGLKGAANRGGLYLYTLDDRPRVGGISVMARLTTDDAAFDLLELFKKLTKKKAKKLPTKKAAVKPVTSKGRPAGNRSSKPQGKSGVAAPATRDEKLVQKTAGRKQGQV